MPDYYSLLVQKIREAQDDPAKLRELVYETARLALKRHVNVYYPAVSLQEGKRLIGELDAAIERLEADVGGAVKRPSPAAGKSAPTAPIVAPYPSSRPPAAAPPEFNFRAAFEGKTDADGPTDRKPDETPVAPAQDTSIPAASPDPNHETAPTLAPQTEVQGTFMPHSDEANPARPAGANNRFAGRQTRPAFATRTRLRAAFDQVTTLGRSTKVATEHQGGPDDAAGSRELVLVADHNVPATGGATYLVRPKAFPTRHDEYFRDPPKAPGTLGRAILIGVAVVSQVAVVILAGAAFYIANWGPLWGRGAPSPAVQEVAAAPPRAPAKVPPMVRAVPIPDPAASPATLAGAATAAAVPTAIAAAPALPRPTAYGVYAISDNRLIELEQVATAQVDPRARTSRQIVKPSRTVIFDGRLSFIAYRRDLTTSAPDKVPVRIAARIARAMTMDPFGKTVTAPPPTETWLIREQGYDLRVLPMRESSEMVMLRPESDDFAFPPGRYELMLGGQSYDFAIAGVVTDPAQCVEGVATASGPAFYECRVP